MTRTLADDIRNVGTIAARDARDMWHDGRFRWTSVLIFATLFVSLLTGWAQTSAAARLHDDAQRTERNLSLEKGDMNPHAAAHYGAFVFRPIEPLAAVDPGIDPFVGVSVFLEAHQQQLARHRPAEDATPIRRLGELSAAMSLQLLVPLLVVVLTHGAFAAEREQGTLRQLASLGIGRWTLTVGKALGAVVPLAAVLLPASFIGVAAMLRGTGPRLDAGAWSRAWLLIAAYLAYFGIWISLGLIVSARARSPRPALVSLLALWFLGVFVAPPLGSLAMAHLAPAPTSAQLTVALDDAKHALLGWNERVERVEERFLADELPSGAGIPSNPEVIALVDAETDETAIYDEHFDRLFAAHDRQTRWYLRFGAIAPSLAIQALSMALSGTDYDHYRRFVEATSLYRRQFVQTLNAELSAYEGINVFDYTGGRELWAKIPEFSYQGPLLRDSLSQYRVSAASLAAWLLATVIGLGWATATMRIN